MSTSTSNRKVKEVQALNRKASYRRECGLYTVEGIRANVTHFYEKTVSVMEQACDLTFGADFKQGGEKK